MWYVNIYLQNENKMHALKNQGTNIDMRLSRTPQPFLNTQIRRPYSLLDGLMFIDRNCYWY